jgi:ankyrin repeat protein
MERIEGQLADQVQLAKQVLSWITCTKRPLTTLELQHALAVEVGESELDEENLTQIEDMVSVCAGLVTVDKESGIIRLVHHTTQEYFERSQKHWFPDAETEITTYCIAYLSFNVFESGFCKSDEIFAERLRLNPFYDYAAHYWGVHARQIPTYSKIMISFLRDEAKVEASSQGLFAIKDSWKPQYSQRVPKQVKGLHLAAYFGIEQAIDIIIQHWPSVEIEDDCGRTPLWFAADGGHEAVVRLLLDKGANIQAKDSNGETPLSRAVREGHEAVVRLLLDKGVDAEIKDKLGITPMLLAAGRGHETVVQLLLEKGANVETEDNPGITPLLLAAEQGHKAIVQRLVEKGADIEAKDGVGMTPLSWAAEGGHEAIIRLLLDKGADIEAKDSYNKTPLWYAARAGHEAVVRLLLDRGAYPEARDNPGALPMWYAWRIRDKIVERLRHSHAT